MRIFKKSFALNTPSYNSGVLSFYVQDFSGALYTSLQNIPLKFLSTIDEFR
ncbi:MAG: hypothetical protein N2252_00205 [Candidatus Kryptonium sp.]|nr:hypothetical protein [Candidatus Kryptonium sp.]